MKFPLSGRIITCMRKSAFGFILLHTSSCAISPSVILLTDTGDVLLKGNRQLRNKFVWNFGGQEFQHCIFLFSKCILNKCDP